MAFTTSTGALGRVMVVDDDPLLRRTIGRTLARAGIQQVHAASGAEALEQLRREAVDVVLTDYDMPGLNGQQLIEQAGDVRADVPPFVLLTGVDGLSFNKDASPRFFGVLRKPVDDQELLQTIGAARELQQRRCQVQDEALSVLLLEGDADDTAKFMACADKMSMNVRVAHCGGLGHALDAATRQRFDVAVVDLHTPDSQGFDTLRRLRSVAPGMALVILTREADDTLAEQALSMGAQEFLVKQRCGPLELESALRRAQSRKASERRLMHVATHDPLTDLANATSLRSLLRQRVERIRQGEGSLALLFLDLDDFKLVNDEHGHAAGDAVLNHVAHCLKELTRTGDLAARMGGDEFALLLSDVSDERSVRHVAERLIGAIERPVPLAEGQDGVAKVSASIDIALCPQHSRDPQELLQLADEAMYTAKESGGGAARSVHSMASHHPRAEVESLLRLSAAEGRFGLAMQAQQPLVRGRPLTYESLLRWPARPDLGPAEFVPWLEDLSLLDDVTGWVLARACEDLRNRLDGGADARVSVNVGVRLVRQDGFAQLLHDTLRMYGVAAERLELELTEASVPIDEPDLAICLQSLRRHVGVRIVLDGFGAGQASLTALQGYDLSGIKLDALLVRKLATERRARALCEGVVFLAHKLGLDVVAEGVETAEQLRWVESLGCDAAQGFFVARPQLLEL